MKRARVARLEATVLRRHMLPPGTTRPHADRHTASSEERWTPLFRATYDASRRVSG